MYLVSYYIVTILLLSDIIQRTTGTCVELCLIIPVLMVFIDHFLKENNFTYPPLLYGCRTSLFKNTVNTLFLWSLSIMLSEGAVYTDSKKIPGALHTLIIIC